MIVFVSKFAGGLVVRPCATRRASTSKADPDAGGRVHLRPGQRFRGHSYAELQRLGNGCHELGQAVATAGEPADQPRCDDAA